MGQYFKIVNLDKKEYLVPSSFGAGGKLGEGWETLNKALILLLASGLDGDDDTPQSEYMGRWAGDRITIAGDYDTSGLYQELKSSEYTDISKGVVESFGFRVIDFSALIAARMRAHPFGLPPNTAEEE